MSKFLNLVRSKDWIGEEEHLEEVDEGLYGEKTLHWFTDTFITPEQLSEAIEDPDVYVGVVEHAHDVGFVINLCEPIAEERVEESVKVSEDNPQAETFFA